MFARWVEAASFLFPKSIDEGVFLSPITNGFLVEGSKSKSYRSFFKQTTK